MWMDEIEIQFAAQGCNGEANEGIRKFDQI